MFCVSCRVNDETQPLGVGRRDGVTNPTTQFSPLPREMPPVLSTLSGTSRADLSFQNEWQRPHLEFFTSLADTMGGESAEKALALSTLITTRFMRVTDGPTDAR